MAYLCLPTSQSLFLFSVEKKQYRRSHFEASTAVTGGLGKAQKPARLVKVICSDVENYISWPGDVDVLCGPVGDFGAWGLASLSAFQLCNTDQGDTIQDHTVRPTEIGVQGYCGLCCGVAHSPLVLPLFSLHALFLPLTLNLLILWACLVCVHAWALLGGGVRGRLLA